MGKIAEPTFNRVVTAAMADNMAVGSLLFASPPQAQSKPCVSASRASSGIASIGSYAPELNSMSIFIMLER
jgi:hypothetical protein